MEMVMNNKPENIRNRSRLKVILIISGLCSIAMLLWQCWIIIRNPADPEGLRGLVDPLIMVAAFAFIYLKMNMEKKKEE